jgi:SAM-dependent methyltransferase
MEAGDSRASHWQLIYARRRPHELSWFQAEPTLSLRLIEAACPNRTAGILDVGGGTSRLVDGLLERGYARLGVLDVAKSALAVVSERLGQQAEEVEFFAADVTEFESPHPWDLWHDRAVLHFLTDDSGRVAYRMALRSALPPGGHVVIATFAPDAPPRCSGLDVVRYDAASLTEALGPGFELVETEREEHQTPAGTIQPFVYCLLRRVR